MSRRTLADRIAKEIGPAREWAKHFPVVHVPAGELDRVTGQSWAQLITLYPTVPNSTPVPARVYAFREQTDPTVITHGMPTLYCMGNNE